MSRARNLARIIDNDRALAKENIAALRFQAFAWRQIAMIACADPKRAAKLAQTMLFKTVPWVDAPFIEKFIAEHQKDAEDCGKRAGIFS